MRFEDRLKKNVTNESTALKNTYYTYAAMIDTFKEFIINTDLKDIKNKLQNIIVATQIPYKWRYMKTRLEKENTNRPILSVNGSIFPDAAVTGMLSTHFFNEDLSGKSYKAYANPVFNYGHLQTNKEVSLYMIPKSGAINIEFTYIDNMQQPILNLKEMWDSKKFRDYKYVTAPIWVKGIIPRNTVLNLAIALGIVDKPQDIVSLSYQDVYNFLMKFACDGFRLTYEKDGGTGNMEVVLAFQDIVYYTPEVQNMDLGETRGFVSRDFTLTRGFLCGFNMPNIYILESDKIWDLDNLELKVDDTIKSNIITDLKLDTVAIADEFISNGFEMLCEATYEHPKNSRSKSINLIDLLIVNRNTYGQNLDVYNWYIKLKDNDIGVDNFFNVVYYRNGQKVDPVTYVIDYENMTLSDNTLSSNDYYKIALYIDLKELQEYSRGYGYEKLK